MAGKEGDAAGRLGAVAQMLQAVLEREARALLALDASADAPGVEKTAKAARAVADASRSVHALAAAVDRSPALPAPESAGADMDDEEDGGDACELQRRRERLVERFADRFDVAARHAERDGPRHDPGGGAALAVAGGSGPAP